jgi:hypothetical protein
MYTAVSQVLFVAKQLLLIGNTVHNYGEASYVRIAEVILLL